MLLTDISTSDIGVRIMLSLLGVIHLPLWELIHFHEATLSTCFRLPSEKGSTLKVKNLLPLRRDVIHFREATVSIHVVFASLLHGAWESAHYKVVEPGVSKNQTGSNT